MKLTDPSGAPVQRGDLWDRDSGDGWSRLRITTAGSPVDLMIELTEDWLPPFYVLYVHVAPRTSHQAGRYQSPPLATWSELRWFLDRFRDLLEHDARQNLWIAAPEDERQIIYDRHEVVYAYGDDERVLAELERLGFEQGRIQVPEAHQHHYHLEYDARATELMRCWDWQHSPLTNGDDQH